MHKRTGKILCNRKCLISAKGIPGNRKHFDSQFCSFLAYFFKNHLCLVTFLDLKLVGNRCDAVFDYFSAAFRCMR
jgi:hypothetical protein